MSVLSEIAENELAPVAFACFYEIAVQCDCVQMLELAKLVHFWQVPDAVAMKIQHTQFFQLTQNL